MRWRTRGAILAQPHPEGPSVHAIPKQIESKQSVVAQDPRLLPWCAQAHPNEIGTELVELLDDRRFIFGLKIAVTRADNLGLRVLRLKRRSQLGHAFRRTTQKIMADRR